MKIKVETDANLTENEVIIKCRGHDDSVEQIKQSIMQAVQKRDFIFYQNNVEYYLPLDTILFFETSNGPIHVHTAQDIFVAKQKLYELEQLLPPQFIRISKSAIVNVNRIYSVERHLTAPGCICFYHTLKQVYVSRNYHKNLKNKIEERRLFNEK